MPKMTSNRIEFLPIDRQAVSEQSPGITPDEYAALFNQALQDGTTTYYFKYLEEIHEKDPDINQAIETRSSYVTSKEWEVQNEDGEVNDDGQALMDALMSINGDVTEGLLSFDDFLASLVGTSYLVGISFSEIITDDESIVGFNFIPHHFLTFQDSTYYPKLYTQDSPTGVEFNKDKMIGHYFTKSKDPARGYLGNAIGWQYVFKRQTIAERERFEEKYGKGFLLVNMPGDQDTFTEDWNTAKQLINNYSSTDGAVFGTDVMAEFKESMQAEGDYFWNAEDHFEKNITRIILGQDSTTSAENSNRSTAEVHESVLEKRILDDIAAIEETINNQLLPKVQELLSISGEYSFKFVMSELEATLDEDMDEEGAVENDEQGNPGQTETQTEEMTDDQ